MALLVKRTGADEYGTKIKVLMCGEPGCVAGDTVIGINRGGKSSSIAISDLCCRFNGGRSPGNKLWRPDIETTVRCEVNGHIRLRPLAAAVSSGEKLTSILRTSSREVRATVDHQFMTQMGWLPLSELVPGDMVLGGLGKGTATPGTGRKPRYREQGQMGAHPFARQGTTSISVPYHRLVAEAGMNSLGVNEFIGRIIDGNVDGLLFLDPAVWAVHHMDRKSFNNDPGNLKVLSHTDHLALHGGADGWTHVLERSGFEEITAIIKYGVEPTFDLVMADEPHNFMANGFVVHNSGKTRISSTFPDVFYANADAGLMSVADRHVPFIDITTTEQLNELRQTLAQPYAVREGILKVPVQTVVIDTLDAIQRLLVAERLRAEKKDGMAIADWGWLGDQLRGYVRAFRNLDMHVVFTCHLRTVEDGESGETFVKPALQGAMQDEIAQYVDVAGLLRAQPESKVVSGQAVKVLTRVLQTAPDARHPWLKDRSGKLPMELEVNLTNDFSTIQKLMFPANGTPPSVTVTAAPTTAPTAAPPAAKRDVTKRPAAAAPVADVTVAAEKIVEAAAGEPVEVPSPDAGKTTAAGPPAQAAETVPQEVNGSILVNLEAIPGDGPLPAPAELPNCEVCGKQIETSDLVELGRIRFRKLLCKADYIASDKVKKTAKK